MSQSYSPTNIEWVVNPDGSRGFTANPIKGKCPHFGTPICGTYCYVQREALRNPKLRELYSGPLTFHPKVLDEIARRKKPATFFMGSMIDLWAEEIHDNFLNEIARTTMITNHQFIFLTKNPTRYKLFIPHWIIYYLERSWLGATITNQKDHILRADRLNNIEWGSCFLSLEPLMGPLRLRINPAAIKQIIIGAMTGLNPVRPEKKWVLDIIEQADAAGVRVFIKDNLFKIYPDLPKRRELAWMV